jgi:hypothetical protein
VRFGARESNVLPPPRRHRSSCNEPSAIAFVGEKGVGGLNVVLMGSGVAFHKSAGVSAGEKSGPPHNYALQPTACAGGIINVAPVVACAHRARYPSRMPARRG